MLFGLTHIVGFLWHVRGSWSGALGILHRPGMEVAGVTRPHEGGAGGWDLQSSPDPGAEEGGVVEAAGPSEGATQPGHPGATRQGWKGIWGASDIARALQRSNAAQPRAWLLLKDHRRKFS